MKCADDCRDCGLCETRKNIVWGDGPDECGVMFVGEAPGYQEDASGRPFEESARVGNEFEHLLNTNGMTRDTSYVTNTVKCHPAEDRNPKPEELAACRKWLDLELLLIKSSVITPIGRFATQAILGDFDMETVHGIPFKYVTPSNREVIVVPSFHPGAGLRSSEMMLKVQLDFRAVSDALRGRLLPRDYIDPLQGTEQYRRLTSKYDVRDVLRGFDVVAVDTESINQGLTPYMVSFSVWPGMAYVIMVENFAAIDALGTYLSQNGVTTLIHNSLYDLPILDSLGVRPSNMIDTMVMAYLLQAEPQGLKDLAFRHCGMKMKSYEDMIAIASRDIATGYLRRLLEYDWPNPDPILEWKADGSPHVKQPQNIKRKIAKILKSPNREEYWDKWHTIDPDGGRRMVEEIAGPMPQGDLSMIPIDEATFYSARDADATIRVYPYLKARVEALGLDQTLAIDMSVIPMVQDMMGFGIRANTDMMAVLGEKFGTKMTELEFAINQLAGRPVMVGSPQKVSELLFQELKIRKPRKR